MANRLLQWMFIPILVGITILTGGCIRLYDPEASQEQSQAVIASVQKGQSFGQTFVSRRPRLEAISLPLSITPDTSNTEGTLSVSLYRSIEGGDALASRKVNYRDITASNTLTLDIPIQTGSAGSSYYLHLETEEGVVQVMGQPYDVYPGGFADVNGSPLPGDASFRLFYDYDWRAVLADIGVMFRHVWLVLPLGVMLFVPGYLVLDSLGIGKEASGIERLALYLGFSLAAIPVMMTWTSLLGIKWSSTSVWFTGGLLTALALWRSRHSLLNPKFPTNWNGFALAGVVLFSLLVRTSMVRDLSASPWVDSVHHGVITRLILDNGGFPETYSPYLSLDSTQYHAGFHSLLATFLWFSDLDMQTAMIIFGQVLNALAVGAVFLITNSLSGSRTAGVLAGMITGLLTPMPAYYTSWGRYTHLTGLLILPVVFILVRDLVEHRDLVRNRLVEEDDETYSSPNRSYRWKLLLVAGIAGAGLFLTHYRVAVFLGCLVIAYLLIRVFTEGRWRSFPADVGWVFLAGLAAGLILAPWLPEMITQLIIPRSIQWNTSGGVNYNTFAWNYLTAGSGNLTLVLAGLGILLGLVLKRWFTLTLALWVGLMFALSNIERFDLPGSGFINNTSVQISLFMPISILGGYLLAQAMTGLKWIIPAGLKGLSYALVLGLSLAAMVYGARTLIPLLNPVTFLYRETDQQAMQWIDENISEQETIVVNLFSWGYGLYAGSDGGYWISPLTGVKTIPPPVLYGLTNDRSIVRETNLLSRQLIEQSQHPEELATIMHENDLRYLYIGAKGGPFSAQLLSESPFFQNAFTSNGTWIFKLTQLP